MQLVFKFLTLSFILSHSFSVEALDCKDNEIGNLRKTQINNSFSEALKAELVSEINIEEELIESLDPDISIGLNDFIDLDVELSRNVKASLPKPISGSISQSDVREFQTSNRVKIELIAEAKSGVLFSSGFAGVQLIHAHKSSLNDSKTNCDSIKAIVSGSPDNEELANSLCEKNQKKNLKGYFTKTVDFFSSGLKNIYSRFTDTQRGKIFSKDPLAPLKIHSLVGLPINHRIFLEEDKSIAIDDKVEHTTYFNILPLGLKFDYFGFSGPSYGKYRRFFRTFNLEKKSNNQVVVVVKDTVLYGTEKSLFNIDPKLLNIIRLKLGNYSGNKYSERSLSQRFEIDLNHADGVEFFKSLLSSTYRPNLSLFEDSLLVRVGQGTDSVTAYTPVFTDGFGKQSGLALQIPGLFKFKKSEGQIIKTAKVGDDSVLIADGHFQETSKRSYTLSLPFIKIHKKDKSYGCDINAESVNENKKIKHLSLNCHYNSKYLGNEDLTRFLKVLQFNFKNIISSKELENVKKLYSLENKTLAFDINLSFSDKELNKLKKHSEEETYHQISKILFPTIKMNVFSKKNRNKWQQNINSFKNESRLGQSSNVYRACNKMLSHEGIITVSLASLGERPLGISKRLCHDYFKIANKLNSSIVALKSGLNNMSDYKKLLSSYSSINQASLFQKLLITLTGGIQKDNIRYSYALNSNHLKETILGTNGVAYSSQDSFFTSNFDNSIKIPFFKRINNISLISRSCERNNLKVKVVLEYPINRSAKIDLFMKVRTFPRDLEDEIHEFKMAFVREQVKENNLYEYEFSLELPDSFLRDKSHISYIELRNEGGEALSREVRLFLQKIDQN